MKTLSDRLKELEQKENQLKQQKKKLKAEISKQERNKRTKRLIEIGAEIKKLAGITDSELLSDQFSQDEVIQKVVAKDEYKKIIENILKRKLLPKDLENFKIFLDNQEARGQYFSRGMNQLLSESERQGLER